ncbi:MAG: sulfite exporter TauE/SafE family protein [Actinomycetaceae bacterium]|nr:sulfite exporter TauE/SafE family protein [Arcanobacterium sp.]MDD7505797.1 sulfite exporter TauE/SafE family protein [Actinomycetaceae bacterium]
MLIETILIGVGIGLLAGALGIGGGILAIPVLVYLLGQDPHAATAESLVIIIVTSLAALPSRFKHKQVRLGIGLVFGLCSSLGAVLGTKLNLIVGGPIVMYAFACLILVVAGVMLKNALHARAEENAALERGTDLSVHEEQTTADDVQLSWRKLPLFLMLGTALGVLVGFFGIGGGFAMIPVLVLMMKYSIRVASGTSFIVILVVSGVSLVSRLGSHVDIDWIIALLFAVGSGVGSAIGSPLSNKARASTLTFIFVALLLAVSVYTFIATSLGW